MSVSPIVHKSDFSATLMNFSLATDTINKSHRRGPKGYEAFRFIATSDIIDHQNEVVDPQALAEVLPIMQKQGARIQGTHTNYPLGEFFNWGFCKVKDRLSIWVDVEIYDDYQSQREDLEKIKLPTGHPEKLGGMSLGGKKLKAERVCDMNRCWTHIKKLEGWELSIVNNGAVGFARQINEDTDTLEGLELPIEYIGKSIQTVTQNMTEKRDDTGRFVSKEKDCVGCPSGEVKKMSCPKCDGAMEEGKCNKCDKAKDENVDANPNEENPKDPKNQEGENLDEPTAEPNGEPSTNSEDKMNYSDDSDKDDNMSNDTAVLQSIEQKLDTTMESLNIGKKETNERFLKLEKQMNVFAKAFIKEQGPPETIEKDGVVYRLETTINKEKEEPKDSGFETTVDLMGKITKELASLRTLVEDPKIAKEVVGDANIDPHTEDEDINKSAPEGDIIKNQVKTLTDPALGGLNHGDAEFLARSEATFEKTSANLGELDMYVQ